MPARDIRDEHEQEGTPVPEPAPLAFPQGQLPLTAEQQQLAVAIIQEDFRTAKEARDARDYGLSSKGEKLTFDSWMKQLTDLYFGRREPKTEPWKFCSNRSMMIAMAILETMHARMFPAVYNEELTRWRPGKVEAPEKAERIERLMFWWIRVRAKLREFFDRWTRMIVGYGSVLTETSWDVQFLDLGTLLPATDALGQPVLNPDGTPQEVPAGPEPFVSSRSDLIPLPDIFLQAGATSIQRDPVIIRVKYLFRELEEMEARGQAVNVTQSLGAKEQLQELLIVPGVAGEGMTPDEVAMATDVKRRNLPVECVKYYGAIDFDGDGYPEQVRLLIVPEHDLYLGGVLLRDVSDRGIRHLDLTQFIPRLDEPQGLLGLGVLEQVKELAHEIDAIFNQMTDANTLSILRPIFYDTGGDLDAGALKLKPNTMTPVPNPSQNVFIPEFNIPTERLMLAVRLVLEFIERLTAASSYVFGKESEIVGGSGTATRTQAILGSAEQRFAVPVQRLREGAARIMTQHLDLVQKNLPPGMEERILGMGGEPIFGLNELSKAGIRGEFDAYLLPDESLGSKEAERTLAQNLYTILTQNLIVATDPTKLYKLTADLLKAWGKDPVAYLGPAPDPNAMLDPAREHELIIQGLVTQVKATVLQNPIEHIMAHQQFLQDPILLTLPPDLQQQVVGFIQAHIQEHMQLFATMMAAAQSSQRKGSSNAQRPGAARSGTPGTQPVGPEPGVGAPQDALAQALARQGTGESGRFAF